jgi:Xaa-Pro aminopeptidase
VSNITKIRNAMLEKNLSALLLTDEKDRLYASGFPSSYGYVLILRESAYFLTDSRYLEAASERVTDAALLLASPDNSAGSQLRAILEKAGVSAVGAQEESLSFAAYRRLEAELGVGFLPAQEVTGSLRRVKERYEVDCIIAAQRIAEKAFDKILGTLKPGLTEKEVAAELEYHMMRNGAEGLAFETICVSGQNTSRPHGAPGAKKLCKGEFVTMDFGCRVNGYCSDMTRTVALGRVTDEMRKVYETVLSAQKAALDSFRAGIEGRAADKAARGVIIKAGFGRFFGHGLGHGVGLDVHEGPSAGPRDASLLPAGAVVTCEPGIYIPGRFGVRIEDMVLITNGGCENLTRSLKNLLIL